MGFERFGRLSFTSQAKTNAFVDYLEQGDLYATRGSPCNITFFPPRADCYSCLGSDMEWVKLNPRGELISFTRSYFAPTGFEEDVPYILAVAQFNDTKVFGRFKKGFTEKDLSGGMAVKVEPVTFPDGQISYQFEPVS